MERFFSPFYDQNKFEYLLFYCFFLLILVSEGLREIKPLVVPEVFTTRINSGDVIYSMVFKPHNFTPGRKYPTVLSIYGGPQVQLVSNTFKVRNIGC